VNTDIKIVEVMTYDEKLIEPLSLLLTESVRDGASLSFLPSIEMRKAEEYWRGIMMALSPFRKLWVVWLDDKVIGTTQLISSEKENSRHRGSREKTMILKGFRGLGVATKLEKFVDDYAVKTGHRLLLMDSMVGSDAARLYSTLGWICFGEVPDFAVDGQGRPYHMAFFYKQLGKPLLQA
jgi:GNAT superfamily N-acetyltransferase